MTASRDYDDDDNNKNNQFYFFYHLFLQNSILCSVILVKIIMSYNVITRITLLNNDIDKADEEKNIEADDEEENENENNETKTESDKPEKKLSRKKLQKLKLKEEAFADSSSKDKKDGPTERTKTCAVCNGEDILLFRCQWDTSKQWRFVCT